MSVRPTGLGPSFRTDRVLGSCDGSYTIGKSPHRSKRVPAPPPLRCPTVLLLCPIRQTAVREGDMDDRLAQTTAVQVVSVKIPFLDLVVLLVKLALAMIPALFIIYAVTALFWTVLGGVFGHHGQATSM